MPDIAETVEQFNKFISDHPELLGANVNAPWPTPYGWEVPDDWFKPDPNYKLGQSTIITPKAKFTAWSHDWHTYHIGTTAAGEQQGWQAEKSKTGNKAFHQGTAVTASGDEIEVGVIPLMGGHADAMLDADEAQKHYDDPANVRVVARANETEDGCQLNGFVIPGTTFDEVGLMRLMGLSGDWRWFPQLNDLDYIGACFVPRQGLPKGVVKASMTASLQMHSQSLFEEEKLYKGRMENGRFVSVQASVNTLKVKEIKKMESVETKLAKATVLAEENVMDGETSDMGKRLDAVEDAIIQIEEMIAKIMNDQVDIDEIDEVTPDS